MTSLEAEYESGWELRVGDGGCGGGCGVVGGILGRKVRCLRPGRRGSGGGKGTGLWDMAWGVVSRIGIGTDNELQGLYNNYLFNKTVFHLRILAVTTSTVVG